MRRAGRTSTRTPGTTSSTTSRSGASSRSSGPTCCGSRPSAGPRLLYDWLAEKLAARLVGRSGAGCRSRSRSTTSSAATSASAAGARRPTRGCARSCARCSSRRRQRCASSRRSPTSTSTSRPRSTRCSSRRSTPSASAASRTRRCSRTRRTGSPTCRPSAASCSARWSTTCSGKLSASPTYVISDEDMLEFICALQSEHLTPEKLFHELEHSHLLLIGSDFSNWLARLFLRMAKRKRLSDPRDVGEILADDHTAKDGRLVAFLQQVSVRTRVYAGAAAFVDELHRRWQQRQAPASARGRARAAALPAAGARDAGERGLHQLCARGPAGRAAPEGGARRGGARRPGSTSTGSRAATTTTARSAPTSRAAASSCRSSRRRRSAGSKATSGASGATPSTARATWPTARCSSCRSASTTRRRPTRWCRTGSGRCTSRAPPGGEPSPEFVRRLQELLHGRRPRMTRYRPRPAGGDPARPREPVARPVELHRGDARLFPRPRRGGRRARAARAAQAADGAVRPVRPRQDLAAARRPGAAAARRGVLPGVRAHRLFAGVAVARRADQAGDLPGHRRDRALDAGRRPRSKASRSGSSCTTAATCCATRAGARCCRC